MKKYAGKIMQWTLVSLTIVVLMIVCVMPAHKTMAAITVSTALDSIDAWQALAAGTLAVGNAEDVTDYGKIVCIEVALTDTDAQAGCTVIVEVSYGDDDWMTLVEFTGTAETPATTDVNDASSTAGDAYMILEDSATGDFDVPGRKWMVVDGTVANSESFRTQSNANPDTVTLCQDTMRNHANALACWDRVDDWTVKIPTEFAYVRILVNNTDADADMHWRSFVVKVSAL